MVPEVVYSRRERMFLALLAVFDFVGLNGAFVYGLLTRPDALSSALANPIAAAFIIEALVLAGVLAYLLRKWGASQLHWGWFVVLSLIGGIAFALPVALLWAGNGVVPPNTRGAIGPPEDPDALVRQPRDDVPGGRSSAVALEEPNDTKFLYAPGRRPHG
jgi:hypothetical protein